MAKILVIDDERAIRNTLKEILEFEGYTVEVAENGRVGLDLALATKYDLIYTDIKMPELDGMEVLQAYRKTVQEHERHDFYKVLADGARQSCEGAGGSIFPGANGRRNVFRRRRTG
jgi:CheY-like chemotaxis protein